MVNWKTGELKLRKSDPTDNERGYIIPVKLHLEMVMPVDEPEFHMKVVVPDLVVEQVTMEIMAED